MAALTAASTLQENNGSLTLLKVTFTTVTTAGDTWSSGLGTSSAVGYWATVTSGVAPGATANTATGAVTGAFNGINVKEDGGTFTLYPNISGVPVTLFIWARI